MDRRRREDEARSHLPPEPWKPFYQHVWFLLVMIPVACLVVGLLQVILVGTITVGAGLVDYFFLRD